MYEVGDKVIYQGADKNAYRKRGVVKSIEDKDGKPQLTVELEGGETFTAPIDDWSREFSNACTSTNSVVRNAVAANRKVARNALTVEQQRENDKVAPKVKQEISALISRCDALVDPSFKLISAYEKNRADIEAMRERWRQIDREAVELSKRRDVSQLYKDDRYNDITGSLVNLMMMGTAAHRKVASKGKLTTPSMW